MRSATAGWVTMKLRLSRKGSFRPGRAPGDVPREAVADSPIPHVTVFTYNKEHVEEHDGVSVDEALSLLGEDRVTWINVDGLGDLDVLTRLWDHFGMHPLVREDVANVHQRPKFEEYDGHDYLVLHMVQLRGRLHSEQVSIVFGKNWLVSFQETRGDVFDPVRERIRKRRSRITSGGPDYLAYALLDALVDGFFPVLEAYGAHLEAIEEATFEEPDEAIIEEIYGLRRELLQVRRSLWPLRDAVNAMQRTEGSPLVKKETRTFLRDVYDHVVRTMDMVETYRELASSLTDLYYTTLSHRMNEVMKVLTIVATIFIPLTFIAGIYGMNFMNMPELGWRYGYAVVLAAMAIIGAGMLVMFRRRGWL